MLLRSGSPAGVTFCQDLSSCVTWMIPFDVPTQVRFSAAVEIAMTLMVTGEVVALSAPRLWLTLPLLVVFLEGLARPWEHRQLLETYGERYVRYRESVPRWLPRRSRWLRR